MPDSTRPSLPVKQTCLALASWPFRQNLVQGEKMSCGSAPCCAGCCCCCCSLTTGGGGPFCTFLAFPVSFFCVGGVVWARTAGTVNIVVASANTNAQATGRAGATNIRCSIFNPLADRSRRSRPEPERVAPLRLCLHQIRQERDAVRGASYRNLSPR